MASTDRDHLLDALTEGIEALTSSAAWRSHLEVQGRFHRYSFSNTLLIVEIVRQDPGASRVAGFATWKSLGRAVRKGERAIWILAPMTGRRTRMADGEEHRPILGFRPVAVFDVAQTDGEPLPEVCRTLEGDDPAALFGRLADRASRLGYAVDVTELPGTTNGDCSFGLDTSGYPFGYVACWAGGGPEAVARIKSSGTRIQRAASVILDALEEEAVVTEGATAAA